MYKIASATAQNTPKQLCLPLNPHQYLSCFALFVNIILIFTYVKGRYPLRTQHCGVIYLYVITYMCLQLHAGLFIIHVFSRYSKGNDTVSDDFLIGIMANFTIVLFY